MGIGPYYYGMLKTIGDLSQETDFLMAEKDRFCSAMFALNTHKSYSAAWKVFEKWCKSASREPLPASPETVSLWVASMLSAGLRVSTVDLRITGISHFHKEAGYPPPLGPEVRRVVNGARRLRHETPCQKRALTPKQIWKISRLMDEKTARGLRDRALIVLGFAGAFRRSELAALTVGDVTFTQKGLLARLRWSKTDRTDAAEMWPSSKETGPKLARCARCKPGSAVVARNRGRCS